tara:strand:- start:201 stop:503 length:303 start_codon:yes stop_codon:yes gene_type:complete
MNIHKVELSLEVLIDLEIRSRAMATKNVYHDLMYHAEIEYLNEDTFLSLANAKGNSLKDFLQDISNILIKYKDREPRIVMAIYDPNYESIDIMYKVLSLI